MRRIDFVPLLAALLALPPAASCARESRHVFKLLRLFEAGRCTLAVDGAEQPAPPIVMTDVAGEARPAIALAAGAVARCETLLPHEPCWLDVEAARLDDVPAAVSATPVVLEVTLVAGTERTLLLRALPSAGTKPTALGWAHARIELRDHLGESVRLEFRVDLPPDAASTKGSFALADPRLSPRVDANAAPWNLVDWLSPGPTPEELARPDAAKLWPGFTRLLAASPRDEIATATPPRSARRAAGTWAGARAPELELQAFGCEVADDDGELARRVCDRFARTDPLARDPDDPALHAIAALDAAVRGDRARALGERTLEIELARPRRAPLCIEVTSGRSAAECDAALSRLQDFLAANELQERTLLVVRSLPPDGGAASRSLAVARVPRGWRDRAPVEILDRFDARVPEFAAH